MKSKIFKIAVVLIIILTMTMSNFVLVANGLISYAADNNSTNNSNVEFSAYFENNKGDKGATIDKLFNDEETFLHLQIGVKKEGYFNGQVSLEDANFKLKESDSVYVSSIKDNTITLNQINAGSTADIKIKIEPIKEENFNIGLLNVVSKLNITGIYRNSKEKDINIKATREVKLNLIENNNSENVLNEVNIITNKIVKIDGEEKRLLQFSWNMGLKDNNYPIKEIVSELSVPTIDGKEPEIAKVEYLNNMTSCDYNQKDKKIIATLRNQANNEGKVMWKTGEKENIVFTYVYDKNVKLDNIKVSAEEKVTLYDSKEITSNVEITLNNEEKDTIIDVNSRNREESIYKGKIHSGIDRQYASEMSVKINYAKVPEYIAVKENTATFKVDDNEVNANICYNKTVLNKEQFAKLFGENGVITIYNENKEEIATVKNNSAVDAEGNIVVNYGEKEPKSIEVKTTNPIAEGELKLTNVKTIKSSDKEAIEKTTALSTKISLEYNMENSQRYSKGIKNEISNEIKLENAKTEARLELNKETLSTVITNNIEIKAILKSNNERYDLYKNPQIAIELPSQVESIKINSVDLIYENELKVKDYTVDGKIIKINLEGEQTQYKNTAIEGAHVVVNADVVVNKKAATKDETIKMAYNNQNVLTYANGEIAGIDTQAIKIVAPKDITTINSIKDLQIETIGQEVTKKVMMERGKPEKQLESQIEIINNNASAIENVKILGEFPTNTEENNMNINILEGINLEGVENAKIYYTENENATEELDNTENGWKESNEISTAKKYLITVDRIESQSSIVGTYQMKVPAALEYNQNADTSYQVEYTNSDSKVANTLKSTEIELQTGVGPKAEIKVTPKVGKDEVSKATVKNGEVIKYEIEVSNVGSEDINDIMVTGTVPEGTVLVVPEKDFEYTKTTYYEEKEDKVYGEKIDSLKTGETITKEYEVRVKNDTTEGTKLKSIAQIKYGDVIKEADLGEITTAKGNIRATVKRVSDVGDGLHTYGMVTYYGIVENISDKKQDNVTVETNLPENLEVTAVKLVTGEIGENVGDRAVDINEETLSENKDFIDEGEQEEHEPTASDEVKENKSIEDIEFSDKINIGTLNKGETKILIYATRIKKTENNLNTVEFSIVAKQGNEQYRSNRVKDDVLNVNIGFEMSTNTESKYLNAGDILEYIIKVKNNQKSDIKDLFITDTIPTQLSVNKVMVNDEVVEEESGNQVEVSCDVPAESTREIKIETVVDYSDAREEAESIVNKAVAEINGETIATTQGINHILQANPVDEDTDEEIPVDEEPENQEPGNEEQGNQGQEPGENDSNLDENVSDNESQGDIANGKQIITGIAWYDENLDGKKDSNEELLENIKVKLLNVATNNFVKDESGQVLETTTNADGVYILNNIDKGKYIVVFEYDKTQYALTKYKVQGLSEDENSNVMENELEIAGQKQDVASTDILEIADSNVSDINIGLTKLQNFDLQLEKFVSKIVIQNSKGTTVKEYNDETLAKAELDAKTVEGTNVIVEYKIKVTNVGEIDGYAKKIVDYMPNDLKFSSELNKDWYQAGDVLYNSSIANDKIVAGESKEITLTLTKAMTENNTGRTNNTAEIAESYNELGIDDSNSTPGNRAQGENDMGAADIILSIRTGGIVYVAITIIIVLVLGSIAFIIVKKKSNKTEI